MRQRLFGRKSEQTADPATLQLVLFNEAESVIEPIDEAAEKRLLRRPSGVASASRYRPISLASKSSTSFPSMN